MNVTGERRSSSGQVLIMSVCLDDTKLPLETTCVTMTWKHSSVKQLYTNKIFLKKELQWGCKKGKEARSWGHPLPCPSASQVRSSPFLNCIRRQMDWHADTCCPSPSCEVPACSKHCASWQGRNWQDAVNASCTQHFKTAVHGRLLNSWVLWLGVSVLGSC